MNRTQLGDALTLMNNAGIRCEVGSNNNIYPCDEEVKLSTIEQVRDYIARYERYIVKPHADKLRTEARQLIKTLGLARYDDQWHTCRKAILRLRAEHRLTRRLTGQRIPHEPSRQILARLERAMAEKRTA